MQSCYAANWLWSSANTMGIVICYHRWPACQPPRLCWPYVCVCWHPDVLHQRLARQHANQGERPFHACYNEQHPRQHPKEGERAHIGLLQHHAGQHARQGAVSEPTLAITQSQGGRAQTVIHLVDQVMVPAFLSASADGAALTFTMGPGANASAAAADPPSSLRLEYPPVPRPRRGAVGSIIPAGDAAVSWASTWTSERVTGSSINVTGSSIKFERGTAGAGAPGGAPGLAAFGRARWGGALTDRAGTTDMGVHYFVSLAPPLAPAPAPG
jgi:hypothetical protein